MTSNYSSRVARALRAVILALGLTVGLAVIAKAGSSASNDTTYVYGGPGSLEGKFQTAALEPDPQGWTGIDCLDPRPQLWQPSTLFAENLGNHGFGNLAMWAGRTADQEPDWASAPGYGNSWNAILLWNGKVADPNVATTVTLQFLYNHDLEDGYDFLFVEWNNAGVWNTLQAITGTNKDMNGDFPAPGEAFLSTFLFPANTYTGPDGNLVQLRLRVQSDGAFSDQDGLYDSKGAAQVDDILVSFNGVAVNVGGDPDPVATFEPGDNEGWTFLDDCEPEFCFLIDELANDSDPDQDNLTPQLAFLVEPPVFSSNDVSCRFVSPEIDWIVQSPVGQPLGAAFLRFDTYSESQFPLNVIWTWQARSFVSGSWSDWEDNNFAYQTTGGMFETVRVDLGQFVPPNATKAQVALTALDLSELFGFPLGSTTLTFDNVSIARYDDTKPTAVPSARGLRLERVFPNPFNPATTLAFELPQRTHARLTIVDVRGRRVRTVLDETLDLGRHSVVFDGKNDHGRGLASGVYLVRLEAMGWTQTQRMVLAR